MDKTLKNIIIPGIIIVVISVVFSLVYLPLVKSRQLKKCLKIAEDNYLVVSNVFNDVAKEREITLHALETLDKAEKEKKIEDDRCYMRYR